MGSHAIGEPGREQAYENQVVEAGTPVVLRSIHRLTEFKSDGGFLFSANEFHSAQPGEEDER